MGPGESDKGIMMQLERDNMRWARATRIIALIAVLAGTGTASADETELQLARQSLRQPGKAGEIAIDLDPVAYEELKNRGGGLVEAFPLADGSRVDLQLEPFQVIAPNAVFVTVDDKGEHLRPRPDMTFLRGTVVGDIDSLVMLSLFQNRISGFVRTGGQEFGVGPQSASLDAPDAMKLRVWDRRVEDGVGVCDESEDDGSILDPAANGWSGATTTESGTRDHLGLPQLLIELAVDSTTEWCAHFGNDVSAAESYLVNMVAQISAIYDAEVSELVQIPFLRTFCGVTDPYTDGLTSLADRNDLLDEIQLEWTTNMTGVSRTVAHLFSLSTDAGFSGGLAYTHSGGQSVLCNTGFGYGVTLFPASGGSPASFEVGVAAHELGHNHSSPHTNCLQDSGGQWLSTCALNNCNGNPNCTATGCFPGPVDSNMTGTLMSTGCNSRVQVIENDVVEILVRNAAETASCVGAAGLPGDLREQTGDGVKLSKLAACPTENFQNDDGGWNTASSCTNCQFAWIKRFTPSCFPFRLTRVDGIIRDVPVGRPIRVLVYSDPAETGDPANATLVYTEDVTTQVSSSSVFNEFTLASPVTVGSGDLYFGFYDLQVDVGSALMAADLNSPFGDSYSTINSTDPASFALRNDRTWLIRGQGGAVPAGSLLMEWGTTCNDATTPGQDFAVYRGDIGTPGAYISLTCSTGEATSYFAESVPDLSFLVVVPHTSPVEGSYGLTSAGAERPAAAAACKPQSVETCP